MGTPHHHASAQLSLTFEHGIGQRHMSLRDCMATGVYQRGLGRIAGQIDMAPSKLSEKLAGGTDRKRDIGLDEFEDYLAKTGDLSPIHYLVDKYLRDPALQQQEALAKLAGLAETLPALLAAAGLNTKAGRAR
ncbi:hypothetical protein ASD78_12180 [Lysobacter sp. Root667]|nr:hypothetical protein ASD78_12180 [Lysobacter sp. Root667]